MQHADGLMAILIAVLGAAILFCVWRAQRGHLPYIRRMAGVAAIERAVERATEMGRPIIYGMGYTDMQAIETHASLAILTHVARLAARLQTPLIVLRARAACTRWSKRRSARPTRPKGRWTASTRKSRSGSSRIQWVRCSQAAHRFASAYRCCGDGSQPRLSKRRYNSRQTHASVAA